MAAVVNIYWREVLVAKYTNPRGADGVAGAPGTPGLPGTNGAPAVVALTSTTPHTIGGGSLTFTYTVVAGLGWVVGTRLRAAYDSANYIEGVVTAVSNVSVTINADHAVGTGTYASWHIGIAGNVGTPADGLPGYLIILHSFLV